MLTISVLNTKGGCGKSTIATNLASFFSLEGARVCLVDHDPQRSSLMWLEKRPAQRPAIHGRKGAAPPAEGDFDVTIIDPPAGLDDEALQDLLNVSDTLVVPVLPSAMDVRASSRFLQRLAEIRHKSVNPCPGAMVVNRAGPALETASSLKHFLAEETLPLLATLTRSDIYLQAAEQGLGIFELPAYEAMKEWQQWQALTDWLRQQRRGISPSRADT